MAVKVGENLAINNVKGITIFSRKSKNENDGKKNFTRGSRNLLPFFSCTEKGFGKDARY